MDYNGYSIKVGVYPDVSGCTFHAKYLVVNGGKRVLDEATSGGFTVIGDAERQAYAAARRWIEEQTVRSFSAVSIPGRQILRAGVRS